MRRRITWSILGSVAAALVLAGLGTLALLRVNARAAATEELRDQTSATAEVLKVASAELNRLGRIPATPLANQREQRRRMQGLRDQLDLDGLGFLVLDANGRVVADLSDPLPEGVDPAALDPVALRDGEVVSGGDRNRVWAASAIVDEPGILVPIVVQARTIDPLPGPTFRWFLLASGATLLVSALVALRLGGRLAQPVRDAQAATARIAQGDLSARVPVSARDRGTGDELEELARAVNSMASTLERSRGLERQFLLSVSHDLRTPLTSIRGYAEAITDGATPDAAAAAAVILSESRRLERLVADLLDLAKLDARRFTLRVRPTDLVELAGDSVDGFRRQAETDGVTVTVCVPDHPVMVAVDPDRLAQVVANLIENALKFASSRVEVAVEPNTDDTDDAGGGGRRVRLTVRDDGPGIAPADLPHVFERLYVASATPRRKETGSGLGLAIAKELVEAMGGRIEATTAGVDANDGTTMAVTLATADQLPVRPA